MVQRSVPLALHLAMALIGAGLLVAVLGLTYALASDVGDSLTRNSVRLSLAWYAVALCQMMVLGPEDWQAATARGRLARWCWTWALLCFLVHLAMAFHYFHHWSHDHALQHTREVSGVGEGVFVSYLFGVFWIMDAAYWWAKPASYAARRAGIDRALHGFMLFMIFNGAIVYEAGPIRWAGSVMFLTLAAFWLASRRVRQAFGPENGPKCAET